MSITVTDFIKRRMQRDATLSKRLSQLQLDAAAIDDVVGLWLSKNRVKHPVLASAWRGATITKVRSDPGAVDTLDLRYDDGSSEKRVKNGPDFVRAAPAELTEDGAALATAPRGTAATASATATAAAARVATATVGLRVGSRVECNFVRASFAAYSRRAARVYQWVYPGQKGSPEKGIKQLQA